MNCAEVLVCVITGGFIFMIFQAKMKHQFDFLAEQLKE